VCGATFVEWEKAYATAGERGSHCANLRLCDLAFQVICQMREPWVEWSSPFSPYGSACGGRSESNFLVELQTSKRRIEMIAIDTSQFLVHA
jgi:hypothetical protein